MIVTLVVLLCHIQRLYKLLRHIEAIATSYRRHRVRVGVGHKVYRLIIDMPPHIIIVIVQATSYRYLGLKRHIVMAVQVETLKV